MLNETDILSLYRQLCETVGIARADGARVSSETEARLAEVERQLRGLLGLTPVTSRSAPSHAEAVDSSSLAVERVKRQPMAVTGAGRSTGQTISAQVFCDGACIRNPGPGGYGVIVRVAGQPARVLQGSKPQTTNNEMELTGALVGLRAAIELGATEISVQSDSKYMIDGITKWIKGWQKKGWKTTTGDPVKNRGLWEDLIAVSQGRAVSWQWIRGHAGNAENERCDSIAVAGAKEAERQRR